MNRQQKVDLLQGIATGRVPVSALQNSEAPEEEMYVDGKDNGAPLQWRYANSKPYLVGLDLKWYEERQKTL